MIFHTRTGMPTHAKSQIIFACFRYLLVVTNESKRLKSRQIVHSVLSCWIMVDVPQIDVDLFSCNFVFLEYLCEIYDKLCTYLAG